MANGYKQYLSAKRLHRPAENIGRCRSTVGTRHLKNLKTFNLELSTFNQGQFAGGRGGSLVSLSKSEQ
jgi:hypothetical protein